MQTTPETLLFIKRPRTVATEISRELLNLLSGVLALYVKTEYFRWRMNDGHLRNCHQLLHEQADQLFAMMNETVDRARKIDKSAPGSIRDIARRQLLSDNHAQLVLPKDVMAELVSDTLRLSRSLRVAHEICDRHNDVATGRLIQNWIAQTERRTSLLSEAVRNLQASKKTLITMPAQFETSPAVASFVFLSGNVELNEGGMAAH
jgi:starvation-inducible DNA-binding protein